MTDLIAIADDTRFDAHHHRHGGHPERPERLAAARAGLYSAIPKDERRAIDVRAASDEELARVHQPRYLSALAERLEEGFGQLDPDTYFSPGSAQAAWLAAGAGAELGVLLARGEATRAVALCRPPGHHAEPARAMGFCMINNVAVAAAAALGAGAERVAIVDWDVHHGNGTQNAFFDDPRVLYVSLHQYPFYPGTGAPHEVGLGAGAGYNVNVALPAQEGPETYAYAFRRLVLPILAQFGADLVLVSAGFDAHVRDPLASMALDTASYQAMASALGAAANRAGRGRVGYVLEGGYDLQALEDGMRVVGDALRGKTLSLGEDAPSESGRSAVEQSVRALSRYWTL